ncbi:MAG TPA: hypothetical protein VHE35_04635 [Kofleriaceae bacterium]|nr:hypothetical protein [Kofleriaceae bacterium]
MKARRWPDVVIVTAIAALAAFGVWALWGEQLGLRSDHERDRAQPTRVQVRDFST